MEPGISAGHEILIPLLQKDRSEFKLVLSHPLGCRSDKLKLELRTRLNSELKTEVKK